MSSTEFGVVGPQCVEHFASEVALLAADDFGHRQTLGGAALGVSAAALVVAQTNDGGDVQGTVSGPVTATMEPVAVG
jgi:hypothetical protein